MSSAEHAPWCTCTRGRRCPYALLTSPRLGLYGGSLWVPPTEIVRQPMAVENARAALVCPRPEARRELILDEVAGGVAADSLEQFRPQGSG